MQQGTRDPDPLPGRRLAPKESPGRARADRRGDQRLVCHPGGPKVIDAIQNSLKLPDSAVELSRRSLAEVGNLSSASVLHVLEKTIRTDPPPLGSTGRMIGLGPGVSIELVLLRW